MCRDTTPLRRRRWWTAAPPEPLRDGSSVTPSGRISPACPRGRPQVTSCHRERLSPRGGAMIAPCFRHRRCVGVAGRPGVTEETATSRTRRRMPERRGSTVIENVQPQLDCGRYPVKRVAGEPVRVTADIFKEGHDDLSAVVRWRRLNPDPTEPREQPMRFLGNDVWEAELPLASSGLYAFTVEAWPDSFRTWVHELQRKLEVGRDVSSELLEGAALLDGAAARAEAAGARADAESLRKGQRALLSGPAPATLLAAVDPGLVAAASRHADRAVASRMDRELRVFAERERAVFSAWYEFFPRSASGDPKRHGTFRDAEKWLPYIAGLGF